MEKILVSACLLGDKTRYDGKDNYFPFLKEELSKKYEFIPFCPELEAGLTVPRSPAEIVNNEVINKDGVNLTSLYNDAATKAYQICHFLGIKIAILKDGSPACGPRTIHDGKFLGNKISGLGITARYLISKGIKVYCETDNLEFLLKSKEKKNKFSPITKEENRYLAKPKAKDDEDSLKKKSFKEDYSKEKRTSKDNHYSKENNHSKYKKSNYKKDYQSKRNSNSSYSTDNKSTYKDKKYSKSKNNYSKKDGYAKKPTNSRIDNNRKFHKSPLKGKNFKSNNIKFDKRSRPKNNSK